MNPVVSRAKTVVVIEDDFEVRCLLTAFLESCGYEVSATAFGKEGLSLSRRLKPQAITLDLCLPDMNGLELLSTLKSSRATKKIPVIVISASTDTMSSLDRQRAFSVIRKPFDLTDLEAALASTAIREAHLFPALLEAV